MSEYIDFVATVADLAMEDGRYVRATDVVLEAWTGDLPFGVVEDGLIVIEGALGRSVEDANAVELYRACKDVLNTAPRQGR